MGRASAEDLAIATSEEFGGARGLARLWKTLILDPETAPATKARILGNIQQLLENTSKLYGDRAKLAGMNKSQLEARIVELITKHKMIVPVEGIKLNGIQEEKETETKPGRRRKADS